MPLITNIDKVRVSHCFSILFSLLWLVLLPSQAAGQEKPQLIGLEQGIVSTAALQILLPDNIGDDQIQWMALELDGIDVSQRVSMLVNGKQRIIQITPSQPLVTGNHILRLVKFSANGSLAELGSWTFPVGAGQASASHKIQLQNEMNISYRLNQDLASQSGRELTVNGSLQVQGRVDKPDYQAAGKADISYNSYLGNDIAAVASETDTTSATTGSDGGANLAGPRHLDLGEYLARVQNTSGTIGAAVGHQTLSQESLLVQNFNRRGVSVNTSTVGKQAALTLYSMRTEPVLGFVHGLGFNDPRHRVDGGIVTLKPFSSRPGALAISATYLSGQGQDQNGIGQSDASTTISQGDGWSIAAESHFAKERFKLRAERAGTHFDFDGNDSVLDKKSDTASAALIEFSPWPQGKVVGNSSLQWASGIGYQRTGLYFSSLANPSIPADITTSSAYSRLQFGGFGVGLSLDRQQNNVTDNPELSTQRNDQAALSANYSPQQLDNKEGPFWKILLGQPSLAFSYNRQHQRHLYLPAGGFDVRQDVSQHSWQSDVSFMHDSWSWSVSQMGGQQNDNTDTTSDQRSHQTSLGLNVQFGQRLTLASQWQIGKIHQLQIDSTSRNRVSSVSAQLALVPDKLTAALQLGLNHDRSNTDSVDNSTRTASFKLNWNRLKPNGYKPGMVLWLQGDWQYNRAINITAVRTANYRVLLGVSIDWGIQ